MLLSQKIEGNIIRKKIKSAEFPIHYDVIVVGLGTAGSIAAIASAVKGLRVLGIEKMNCMGGMGTAGGVLSYYFGSTGGYYEELDKKASYYIGSVYAKSRKNNPEAKKYVLEQEALEYGVKLEYESTVTGVFLYNRTVKGISWIAPDGHKTAGCKVLIDCTGDAYICEMAGCNYFWGREIDGCTQPFTSVKVFIQDGIINTTNFDSGLMKQASTP